MMWLALFAVTVSAVQMDRAVGGLRGVASIPSLDTNIPRGNLDYAPRLPSLRGSVENKYDYPILKGDVGSEDLSSLMDSGSNPSLRGAGNTFEYSENFEDSAPLQHWNDEEISISGTSFEDHPEDSVDSEFLSTPMEVALNRDGSVDGPFFPFFVEKLKKLIEKNNRVSVADIAKLMSADETTGSDLKKRDFASCLRRNAGPISFNPSWNSQDRELTNTYFDPLMADKEFFNLSHSSVNKCWRFAVAHDARSKA